HWKWFTKDVLKSGNYDKVTPFPKVEVVPVAIKHYPESPQDASAVLHYQFEYAERTSPLAQTQSDELWVKVAHELFQLECERAESAMGTKRVGERHHMMGGYPWPMLNESDVPTPNSVLMQFSFDRVLTWEFMDALQYWVCGPEDGALEDVLLIGA
ncbi:MAG: hypothetical protein ABI459_11455, partial [Deltaproteobacteria bacterium]